MKIAVLSGKGGTGKTTLATNLAVTLGYMYVDCDVEEPNGFIFLKPRILDSREVSILVPHINYDRCSLCGKCVNACQFNALANTKEEIILFEKLCHSCGACSLICPEGAVEEKPRNMGTIDIGTHGNITCIRGLLKIGEPMAGPIIRKVKDMINDENAILDCAPGSSCNVVKAIKDVDYAVLVTEATEFGLHDLNIAVELVKKLAIPFGVVINRGDEYAELIINYCEKNEIRLIGNIPFDRGIATMYSKGRLLIEDEKYRGYFSQIAENIEEVALCS